MYKIILILILFNSEGNSTPVLSILANPIIVENVAFNKLGTYSKLTKNKAD